MRDVAAHPHANFVGQAVSLRRVVNPPADQFAQAAQAG